MMYKFFQNLVDNEVVQPLKETGLGSESALATTKTSRNCPKSSEELNRIQKETKKL